MLSCIRSIRIVCSLNKKIVFFSFVLFGRVFGVVSPAQNQIRERENASRWCPYIAPYSLLSPLLSVFLIIRWYPRFSGLFYFLEMWIFHFRRIFSSEIKILRSDIHPQNKNANGCRNIKQKKNWWRDFPHIRVHCSCFAMPFCCLCVCVVPDLLTEANMHRGLHEMGRHGDRGYNETTTEIQIVPISNKVHFSAAHRIKPFKILPPLSAAPASPDLDAAAVWNNWWRPTDHFRLDNIRNGWYGIVCVCDAYHFAVHIPD